MENNSIKSSNLFHKLSDFFTRLYNTELPMALLAAIIYFSWLFEFEAFAFIFVIFYATIALIFIDDTAHLITAVILAPFTFASGNTNVEQYFWLAYFLIFVIGALIFHMIYYRKKFKIGKMFFPQLAISIALLLGGVGTISLEYYMSSFAMSAILGVLILVLYFLFNLYRNPDSGIDYKRYLAKVLSWAGIIVSFQIIAYIIKSPYSLTELFKVLQGQFMELGWGIDNNAATMILITAPMTFYLACRKDTKFPILYVLSGALQYACIILTFSRGGILSAIVTGIISLILLIKKSAKRKQIYFAIGLVLVGAIAVLGVKFNTVVNLLKSVTFQGTGDSGRFTLYKEAWECFKKHPFLGVGMGYKGENFDVPIVEQYFFHSTLFQVIGSMGIVGIIAYTYFYIVRYSIIFKNIKKSVFVKFIFISMLGFEAYSMIDTGTFIPVPFMLLMMLMTMFVEEENRQTEFDKEISVYKRPELERASHLFADPSEDFTKEIRKIEASEKIKPSQSEEINIE